ncbi:MAG TPA: DUF1993 domain-containing protein [Caulobacteraceae bacterium]|nr:DUF1993 domain-containing protein [Caulobacteraceae bacterium]
MSLSLHEASIGIMAPMLRNLSALLEKGAAFCAAKGIDPAAILESRLAPDMLPFTRQVYIATDGAKGCAARLAGVEIPVYPDVEATFPELQARIAKTIAFIESVSPAAVDAADDKPIHLKFGSSFEKHFTGKSFLTTFALPNFLFHVTTAYALLRAAGVEIGKRDYLGG